MPKPRGGVRTWAKPGGGGVGCGSGGCDTSEHDDEHEEPSPLSDCSPVGPPALMPGGPDVGHLHQCLEALWAFIKLGVTFTKTV